jgi:drug/metabolite transporter (DMT)-like permease
MFVYLFEYLKAKRDYGNYELRPDVIEARKKGKYTNINPLKFAIPMLCDAVGSTLLLFAYLYIPVSIAQMIQGSIVMITAIFSIIFLKRVLYRHHWSGLLLVVIGIALVGVAVMIAKSDSKDDKPLVGLILMFCSILAQGSQFVVEEKFLGDYYVSPMKVIGWEGIWGLILFSILLPILQFIPCDLEF